MSEETPEGFAEDLNASRIVGEPVCTPISGPGSRNNPIEYLWVTVPVYPPTAAQLATYTPISAQLLDDIPAFKKYIDERLRAGLQVEHHCTYPGILWRETIQGVHASVQQANQEYGDRQRRKRVGFPQKADEFLDFVEARNEKNKQLAEAFGLPSGFLGITGESLEWMKRAYCHQPVLPLPKEWNPPQARRKA